MTTIQEPQLHCKQQTDLKEFRMLVFTHAPALGSLLDQLDAGIFPEPLAVMIAISQGVAYFTDGESAQGESAGPSGIAPGRFCPSC